MNLRDLLLDRNIGPLNVLVLRHRPPEPELRKVLPWLAAEKPDVFNAYQQTQSENAEQAMKRAAHVAAFIGHEPGKALFVGLYAVKGYKPITPKEYWQIPVNVELKSFGGGEGFTEESPRSSILWFDLVLTDFYAHWKGKLIVRWPPPEISWYRWADRPHNEMSVLAILEESGLDPAVPEWDTIDLRWAELRILPTRLRSKLSEWRGVYYIFDTSDGKGYVGSAYGESNLLGRWLGYAARGDGGNRLLRKRDARSFRFAILQRVSPDMESDDVIQLENSWKQRLHTRAPHGLNKN